VHRVGEIFAAVLGPLDRAIKQLRRRHHGHVLGVDAELGAEAAADVGRGHAQACVEVHQRGQRLRQIVRLLGRGVHGDAAVGGTHFGQRAARLDRVRRAAVLPELLLEDIGGLAEGGIGIAERHLVGGDDVRREFPADRG
jgi:hypothetical protein